MAECISLVVSIRCGARKCERGGIFRAWGISGGAGGVVVVKFVKFWLDGPSDHIIRAAVDEL